MLDKRSGFSFIEILISTLITGLLVSALFYTFQTGEYTQVLGAAKTDLQSEVRNIFDWISRDARQAVTWDIASIDNEPTSTHIKFRRLLGWDSVNNTYLLSANFIEYTYDSQEKTMTRLDPTSALQVRVFSDIIEAAFYTRDALGNLVPLTAHAGDLRSTGKLIIVITTQKTVRGSRTISLSLTEEIKIRNE